MHILDCLPVDVSYMRSTNMMARHSFETRPGGRPGLMTVSRVRWVDPGQPKKKKPASRRGIEFKSGPWMFKKNQYIDFSVALRAK